MCHELEIRSSRKKVVMPQRKFLTDEQKVWYCSEQWGTGREVFREWGWEGMG